MTIRKLISGGCALQANMDAIESVRRTDGRTARRSPIDVRVRRHFRRSPSASRYVTLRPIAQLVVFRSTSL